MKSDSSRMYFKSKRNAVRLNVHNIVEKQHNNPESARFESNRLALLHNKGLAVPKLLSVRDNVIEMEYVHAITLPDLIDAWEKNPDPDAQTMVAEGLVNWLKKYYEIMNPETRGDINGRNFLFDNKQVWGVDFEEPGHSTILEDIGLLLAYILTYSPKFTLIKEAFANQIVLHASEAFGIATESVLQSQAAALKMLYSRRKRIKRMESHLHKAYADALANRRI